MSYENLELSVADGVAKITVNRPKVLNALNNDTRVETRSVGNEPRRKVLVVPVSSNGSSDDEE